MMTGPERHDESSRPSGRDGGERRRSISAAIYAHLH